jgi:hypothetical protein
LNWHGHWLLNGHWRWLLNGHGDSHCHRRRGRITLCLHRLSLPMSRRIVWLVRLQALDDVRRLRPQSNKPPHDHTHLSFAEQRWFLLK